MLVDLHCHLDFPEFADNLDDIVERACDNGVGTMVKISTHIRRFDRLQAIIERYDNIFCSIGTHPHNADEEKDVPLDELLALTKHPKVVAVGEAGLDYYYKNSTPENQAAGFRRYIEAARETGLPLEIHTRDADDDTLTILREEHANGTFPAVLHCFTGGRELAMRAVDMGLYVSFSGVLTFKKADSLRDIARDIPLDRLLVETDVPFLVPVPYRGKTNELSYVVHTAAVLAEVKGITPDELANATTDNFFRF